MGGYGSTYLENARLTPDTGRTLLELVVHIEDLGWTPLGCAVSNVCHAAGSLVAVAHFPRMDECIYKVQEMEKRTKFNLSIAYGGKRPGLRVTPAPIEWMKYEACRCHDSTDLLDLVCAGLPTLAAGISVP